ncbi:hypothetical protein F5Y16DRAFT_68813 [Xylariaceae sp. FL0255]|nr:hypothetical protein F5Y16DRAFT_68813 [Xylariaceae sp. FL0255]
MASGQVKSWTHLGDAENYEIMGIRTVTIAKVTLTTFPRVVSNSPLEIPPAIRALLVKEQRPLKDPYPAGGSVLDAYVKILCGDLLVDKQLAFYPQQHVATSIFQGIYDALGDGLVGDSGAQNEHANADEELQTVYGAICSFGYGRSLISSADGLIGLGPDNTEVGDEVWSLMGCFQSLILRPTGESDHLVIGPCRMHGVSDGEAVLGPLPETIKRQFNFRERVYEFVNTETAVRSNYDPRLEPLESLGVDLSDHRKLIEQGCGAAYLYVDPDTLRSFLEQRGVELQHVNLV